MPARHLEYERSYRGLGKLQLDLANTIIDVVATYPFQEPLIRSVTLPFFADLTDGRDARELYTESIAHRRMVDDYLEFGSLLNYRHSWMSLGNLKVPNVRVQARMKMTRANPEQDNFMGVMVRGSSYYSNLGILVAIRKKDGVPQVFVTERLDDW